MALLTTRHQLRLLES